MNVYEEIDQETMMLLLDYLCKRTVEGKQIWENMEYNPISCLLYTSPSPRDCS